MDNAEQLTKRFVTNTVFRVFPEIDRVTLDAFTDAITKAADPQKRIELSGAHLKALLADYIDERCKQLIKMTENPDSPIWFKE
jgi:hypothetical protein